MGPHYFVQGLFVLTGIIALLASALNWDWFFRAQNAQFIVRRAGRKRARLLYGILGLILIGMAIYFYIETTKAIT
jgi:small neutral amino acid transporter SnatA (MarC family)